MTNTRRWPPGPWIEAVRVSNDEQWSYKRYCVQCGENKEIWYFRHTGRTGTGGIPYNAEPLCRPCGDAAYQMQQMDRMVNG